MAAFDWILIKKDKDMRGNILMIKKKDFIFLGFSNSVAALSQSLCFFVHSIDSHDLRCRIVI